MVWAQELNYNTNATAMNMANTIFGDGVTVMNASYTGANGSSATYSGGDAISGTATPGDTGVILSTGNASSFTNSWGQSNQQTNTSTNTWGVDNDADFNAAAGANTYDAAMLDVDFIPTGDVMTMQFIFSSDEYPEYSGTVYNDMVGVWVNGTYVPMSVGTGDSSVGNVNQTNNINLFTSNTYDQYNTEMDGFTVTMTLTIPVIAGELNSIRIGIADVVDSSYDSNVLIAGGSVQTTLVAQDDTETMQIGTTKTIDVLGNDLDSTGGTMQITHINGVAVTVGSTVTLPSGHVVTLNADGTIDVTTDNDVEEVSFTYAVQTVDGSGNELQNDVGFVTVDTIPCFVAGTLIATPEGERMVEELVAGDLVMTRDAGPQPLRWTGRRTVKAVDKFAPIRIEKNTFGTHQTLWLSPQHRVLINDVWAELLFGEPEVLVAAKELVNDKSVRRIEGGTVDYVHLLFDDHQVIFSEGLATESFLPGPQTTSVFEQELIDEICAIFPELNAQTGDGYSPSARRSLKAFEAKVLLAAAA